MKNTLLFTYSTKFWYVCQRSIWKTVLPAKSENLRLHSSNSIENATYLYVKNILWRLRQNMKVIAQSLLSHKAFCRPPLSAVLLRKLTHLLNRTDKMGIFKSMFNVGWTLLTLLRLETHYAWVSRLQTKDIDLTHQGQFLTPDLQIWASCSLPHH